MTGDFVKGFGYGLSGLTWLGHAKLRAYVLVPLTVNVILFAGGIWWTFGHFETLLDWLLGWLPEWLHWLRWIIWPVFIITAALIVFYSFTLIANLIGAPFNGLLAARTERILGVASDQLPQTRWTEIVTAPLSELGKLLYFVGWSLLALLLFLVPVINLAAPLVWVAMSSWMLALEYLDYPLGNHGLSFRDQRRVLAERRLLALGFGAAVTVLTVVPFLNLVAMPAAVIGATRLVVHESRGVGLTPRARL